MIHLQVNWELQLIDARRNNKRFINPLSANNTKWWSNTLKQFIGKLPTNCLNVFDHFVGLALKELISIFIKSGNQISVGQFGITNNPVALSAKIFCNILPVHAKGGKL